MFTKEAVGGSKEKDICLVVNVAVGSAMVQTQRMSNPISMLHLSNEEIDKIIEAQAVVFCQ